MHFVTKEAHSDCFRKLLWASLQNLRH